MKTIKNKYLKVVKNIVKIIKINDDINSLYEYYINCQNCELCEIELVEGMFGANRRCLDHSHKTGLFRNVLCHSCKTKRRENNF